MKKLIKYLFIAILSMFLLPAVNASNEILDAFADNLENNEKLQEYYEGNASITSDDDSLTISVPDDELGEVLTVFDYSDGILSYTAPDDAEDGSLDFNIAYFVLNAFSEQFEYDFDQVISWIENNKLSIDKDGLELTIKNDSTQEEQCQTSENIIMQWIYDMRCVMNKIFGTKIMSMKIDIDNGLITFDPQIDYEKLYTERDELPDIELSDLYGEYEWVLESGKKDNLFTKIKLVLKKDGTAQYTITKNNVSETTIGVYTYINGRVIYTKTNYDDKGKTEYSENDKTVVFEVLKDGTLKLMLDEEGDSFYLLSANLADDDEASKNYILKKVAQEAEKQEKEESNPKTGISKKSEIIILMMLLSATLFMVMKKRSVFPRFN